MFKYYYELQPVMHDRPAVRPPFANDSATPIENVEQIVFTELSADHDEEDVFGDDLIDDWQQDYYEEDGHEEVLASQQQEEEGSTQTSDVGSNATQTRYAAPRNDMDRPSKRVRKNVENTLAEALGRSEAFQRQKLELERKRLAGDEARANTMLELEKEKLKVSKVHAQVQMAELWKSLGLSRDEIVKKLEEF